MNKPKLKITIDPVLPIGMTGLLTILKLAGINLTRHMVFIPIYLTVGFTLIFILIGTILLFLSEQL